MKIKTRKCQAAKICFFILLVLAMAGHVFAVEVNLKVIDNITEKPIENVKIELDGENKRTNEKGTAIFSGIENKTHIITLEKEGYKQTTKEIKASAAENKTIKLENDNHEEEKEFGPEDKPKITVDNLENNTLVKNESLEVKFDVETDIDIERCVLLTQEQNQHGYTIKDSLNEIEEEKNTLSTFLKNNGKFFVRIMCENIAGQSYSKRYSIKAEGFSENSPATDKGHENQESDVKDKIEKPDLVKEIEAAKKEIDESSLDSFERNNEDLVSLLGLTNTKEEGKKKLKELKKRRIDLEELNMGESDYIEQKKELHGKFRELKEEIPKDIEIIDEHKSLMPITFEETQQALQTYLKNRKNETNINQYRDTIEQSRHKQDNISIYSTITQVRVHYLNDSKKEFTKVNKEIDSEGVSQGFYMEIMPEDIVDSLEDIEFSKQYEIVDGLTTLRFSHEHEEFSYLIDGAKDPSVMGDAKTVYLFDPVKDTNRISGLFTSATNAQSNTSIILAIFVLSILSIGFITYKSGFSIQNTPFGFPKQLRTYKEPDCAILLREAIGHIKNNNDIEAIRLYPKILKNYQKLGPKSKRELQPMIAYISDIAELQYLSSLINKACIQMEYGPLDHELVKEIDECYYKLNNNLIKEIKQRYHWYKSLLDLKMQRKDEQVKQIIFREKRGENLSHGVDDNLYGK